jgi:UPF0716 family protein affecting phage T7 exclusion
MAMQGPRAVFRFIARSGKRIGVTIGGFSLLLAGGIMLVTPGPGLITIAAGLAILATEYAWARRMLDNVKQRAVATRDRVRRRARDKRS